jgi:hypothetical protein
MSKITALVLAVILAVAACGIGILSGVISLNLGAQPDKSRFGNKGVLEVICDVEISRPGDTLTPPFDTVKLTLPAIFNFEEKTANYPGEYTISMNRKGTLQVREAVLEIHRPAMFKRHGVVIIGERVTLRCALHNPTRQPATALVDSMPSRSQPARGRATIAAVTPPKRSPLMLLVLI